MVRTISEQLDAIFKPRSIAVIGASDTPAKWGYRLMYLPLKSGFRGKIYPVNPTEKSIMGIPAYASVLDIKDKVDMAVIVVPAPAVPKVLQECIQKGIKGAVLISAGFREVGKEGAALQEEIVLIARKGGLRFIGPNGIGIFSAGSNLNLCFYNAPRTGHIAFISQSGTYGTALAQAAVAKGYGLSKFISIGNQADLTATDYLEYLADDPDTSVIVMYMEGFKDGNRFFRLARDIVKRKPILIYKGGRSAVGSRATQSHTGSLAGQDHVFDAMCRQAGIIRAEEILQPFDEAQALVMLPLPNGRRIGILGSGGQSVVLSDACSSLGLEIPEFDRATQIRFKKTMSAHAPTPKNPFDFAGGLRTACDETKIVEQIAMLPYIDGVICHSPMRMSSGTFGEELEDMIKACRTLGSIPKQQHKPLIVLRFESGKEEVGSSVMTELLKTEGIPVYETPEQCAHAMYVLAKYAEIKKQA